MTTPNAVVDPRQWIAPSGVTKQGDPAGIYYWVLLPASDTDAYTAWQAQNPSVKTVHTEGTSAGADLIVLQNLGTTPALWTLSGFPSKSAKGPATTAADVIQVPAPDKNTLDRIDDALFGDHGLFTGLTNLFGTAGKVLVYGGTALLLYEFWKRIHGADESPKRETSESRPELPTSRPSVRFPPPSSHLPRLTLKADRS